MTIKNQPNQPQSEVPADLPTIAWLQPVRLPVSAFSEFARSLDASLQELEERFKAPPTQPEPAQPEPTYGAIKRHRRPR